MSHPVFFSCEKNLLYTDVLLVMMEKLEIFPSSPAKRQGRETI
jgi:hypothetical protein